MMSFETALRFIVIGQELLIAAIFLFGSRGLATRISGAALMLSIAGYVLNSDPVLRSMVPAMLPALIFLAMIVPFCLWAFSRAVFEHSWPSRIWLGTILAFVFLTWFVFLNSAYFGAERVAFANVAMHVVSMLVVLHAIWFTVVGRRDDLIERRRLFRVIFVLVVAVQIIAVLLVELALVSREVPAWLPLTNVVVIAIMTLALAVPLLRLNPELVAPAPNDAAGAGTAVDDLSAAEAALRQKLLAQMDDGVYRETGLSIGQLAAKLGSPEHALRRLINGHLGFRNFSAFLNSYRIADAKRKLADPELARIPILTIALDLGYGSLGPFNRAFRQATSMTPTEYRQSRSHGHAESE